MTTAAKLSTALFSVVLAAGSFAFAQQQQEQPAPPQNQSQGQYPGQAHHHRHSAEHQAEKLSRELGLSPEQQERLRPILAEEHRQMHELRASGAEPSRAQRKAVRNDARLKMDAVLTEAQQQQLRAIHAEHHHHHHMQEQQQAAPTA